MGVGAFLRLLTILILLVALAGGLANCTAAGQFLKFPLTDDGPKGDWAKGKFERAEIPLAQVKDGSLSYVRAGDPAGLRVIFIHGSPGYAGDWRTQLATVPPGRDYIAVDRPGYGFSRPRKARPKLKDQSAALAPLLETGDGRPVVLVGFSLGGPIAIRTAIDYPDRVAGLVLGSSNLDPDLEPREWYNEIASWWIVRPFIQTDWRNSNREILPHKAELEAMVPLLSDVAVPVAILHSAGDTLVPVGNTDFMRDRMTEADFVFVRIIEGASHMLPIRQPDLTAEALNAVIGAINAEPDPSQAWLEQPSQDP